MTAHKAKVAAAGAAAAFAGILLLFGQQHERIAMPDKGAAVPAAGTAVSALDAGAADRNGDGPAWRALAPAQQLALQPLRAEWDRLDGLRKQKWLQLADRYATLKPEEQKRVHERMREWVKLTPAQRELARETYARTRKIAPAQKTASWENYKQLPEEQKKKLAASASSRKSRSMLPSQASGKLATPPGKGVSACPAGMIKNSVSATPPCVNAPPPPVLPPVQPAQPAQPATPPPQEKPVPANWGITPNNA